MPMVPLFGHEALRDRLASAVGRGALPSSLLLHGPIGVGKQRLALWLGQLLVCTGATPPCGGCQGCRYAGEGVHPDVIWVFPTPRPRDGEPTDDDRAAAVLERLQKGGLYPAPSGSDAIYVATVRSILRAAAMSPAIARRKVVVVGDAERMVPQEGAEAAANAFLKLLEEPPDDTTLILTSSVPGSLLPTVRSRVVAVRVPQLPDAAVRAFVRDPSVAAALTRLGLPEDPEALVRLAGGAPGTLLSRSDAALAQSRAARLLALASEPRRTAERYSAALGAGAAKARAGYTDTLDALAAEVHARAREAVERGDQPRARALSTTIDAVNRAATRAAGNVNPQLITAALLSEMSRRLDG